MKAQVMEITNQYEAPPPIKKTLGTPKETPPESVKKKRQRDTSRLSKAFGPFEIVIALGALFGTPAVSVLIGLPIMLGLVLAIAFTIVICVFSLAMPHGRRLSGMLQVVVGGLLTGRKRWFKRVPVMMGIEVNEIEDSEAEESPKARRNKKKKQNAKQKVVVPKCLYGLQLIEVPSSMFRRGRLGGVGVLFDNKDRTMTAVLPIVFSVNEHLSNEAQESVAGRWDKALRALFSARASITRVTWSSRIVRPVDTIEVVMPDDYVDEDGNSLPNYSIIISADDIDWPRQQSDQTLISLTIDASSVAPAGGFGVDPEMAAVVSLLHELEVFARGISHFGFRVGAPLSPGELAQHVHVAVDPSLGGQVLLTRDILLAERAQVVPISDAPPTIDNSQWNYASFNGSYHRVYWVAEWPNLHENSDRLNHPVPVLQPDVGGVQLASSTYHRHKKSAAQQQSVKGARRAKHDQDSDVLDVVTLVSIVAPSTDHLNIQASELEDSAFHLGFELRAMDGNHDTATIATLPLGRTISAR